MAVGFLVFLFQLMGEVAVSLKKPSLLPQLGINCVNILGNYPVTSREQKYREGLFLLTYSDLCMGIMVHVTQRIWQISSQCQAISAFTSALLTQTHAVRRDDSHP